MFGVTQHREESVQSLTHEGAEDDACPESLSRGGRLQAHPVNLGAASGAVKHVLIASADRMTG